MLYIKSLQYFSILPGTDSVEEN